VDKADLGTSGQRAINARHKEDFSASLDRCTRIQLCVIACCFQGSSTRQAERQTDIKLCIVTGIAVWSRAALVAAGSESASVRLLHMEVGGRMHHLCDGAELSRPE